MNGSDGGVAATASGAGSSRRRLTARSPRASAAAGEEQCARSEVIPDGYRECVLQREQDHSSRIDLHCRSMPRPRSIVELLHADAQPPRRATEGSAGYDLCAYLDRTHGQVLRRPAHVGGRPPNGLCDVELLTRAGVTALIPLGFKARMPHGIEAQIRPRSGTSFKKGLQIPNAPGTIDSDYPDEWMVIVRNPLSSPIRIEHGERIAQMVLARYEVLVSELGDVRRDDEPRRRLSVARASGENVEPPGTLRAAVASHGGP